MATVRAITETISLSLDGRCTLCTEHQTSSEWTYVTEVKTKVQELSGVAVNSWFETKIQTCTLCTLAIEDKKPEVLAERIGRLNPDGLGLGAIRPDQAANLINSIQGSRTPTGVL